MIVKKSGKLKIKLFGEAHRNELEGRSKINENELEEEEEKPKIVNKRRGILGQTKWLLEHQSRHYKVKKGLKERFKKYEKTVEEKENKKEKQTIIPEADLESDNVLVAFWKTGYLTKEGKKVAEDSKETFSEEKIDDTIISRYDFCFIDPKTHESLEPQTILISGVNEKSLMTDKKYRDKFVREVLTLILDYIDTPFPEALKQIFPYMGKFNPNEISCFDESDINNQKFFTKLSGNNKNSSGNKDQNEGRDKTDEDEGR